MCFLQMYKFFAEPRNSHNYFTISDTHREEGKSFLGQKNALENLFHSSPPSPRTTGPALGLPSEWEPGVDVVVDVIRIHRGVALFVA